MKNVYYLIYFISHYEYNSQEVFVNDFYSGILTNENLTMLFKIRLQTVMFIFFAFVV